MSLQRNRIRSICMARQNATPSLPYLASKARMWPCCASPYCESASSNVHRTGRLTPEVHRRYGPAPLNAESAVNILIDVVRDQSGKKYTMDHYQTRFPTNVVDIASFLVRLASKQSSPLFSGLSQTDDLSVLPEPERPKSAPLPPVIHYSAEEPFTKYEMCLIFARILGLPHAHIIPDAGPPPPGTAQLRCIKCHLLIASLMI